MSKQCPNCSVKGELVTDSAAGNVICLTCGRLVEEGILVSEVGFSEAPGGRVHVQGTFVSHNATGISSFRGKANQPSSENVKAQGQQRIEIVGKQMHLAHVIWRGAQRLFSLAVDAKFNKGRRSEYIIASCLYLQCRRQRHPQMLIDFSERLGVNVFELGATYMKLRNLLNLNEPMPEVDPALYNLRFAHRLDFAHLTNTVATDASRLVRRFKADWMTQGRRPAGVCGACLIIAARMSDFLRTPEEVAQVVKTSPTTVRRRLREFAQTKMADMTVAQWRSLDQSQLDADSGEVPPVMKAAKLRKAKEAAALTRLERNGMEELGESEDDTPPNRRKGKRRQVENPWGVVRKVAEEATDGAPSGESDEEDDNDLAPLDEADYVEELATARDDPQEARSDRRQRQRAFMRDNRALAANNGDPLTYTESLDTQATLVNLSNGDDVGSDAEAGPSKQNHRRPFTDFDDGEATLNHFATTFFSEEARLLRLDDDQVRHRVKQWLRGRDPKTMLEEIQRIERAINEREMFSKLPAEATFGDLDDEELDQYWLMEDDERNTRARMWLSHNGKWLQEDKGRWLGTVLRLITHKPERQERKAAYARAHPEKRTKKRKRPDPRQAGPYPSAREAIEAIASEKNFSSRINYEMLRKIKDGSYDSFEAFGLEVMEEDPKEDAKDDEEDDEDDKGEDAHSSSSVERTEGLGLVT